MTVDLLQLAVFNSPLPTNVVQPLAILQKPPPINEEVPLAV